MAAPLTETAIAKATREAAEQRVRKEIADPDLRGLRLRITPTGTRTWVLGMRDGNGTIRRFPLGAFPAMGLSKARDAARAMREHVKKGADPISESKRARAITRDAKDGIGTLGAIIDLYEKRVASDLKSWPEYRRRIENVFCAHLKKPITTMKLSDLQLTADSHGAQQSAAAAVRYLRPVLKWAAHSGRGYAPLELTLLHPPATVKRRDRVISSQELAAILPALEASSRPYGAALRLMLLTLARREEVAGMKWGDLDLQAETWTIPADKAKNGKAHVVPLSRQATALLKARLLARESGKQQKPGASLLVFSTASGGALLNWDRETKAVMKESQTAGWTRHDLRRTGATMLGEMGEIPSIIEAALNHTNIGGQLAAIYNKALYRPQVAKALQRLADALDGIQAGRAKVVSLGRRQNT